MLHICCIRAGAAFAPAYVEILHDMVRRNLAEGFEGEFVCFTDQDDDLTPGIVKRGLPAALPGWWSKLALHQKGLFPDGDRVLFFDLGNLIVGDIDTLASYKGPFATLRDFYRPEGLQSAVMAWEAGTTTDIWNAYKAMGCPQDTPGGDQTWVEAARLHSAVRLQDALPEMFCSYKLIQGPPNTASVVVFHGEPKPHELGGWVSEIWKVGGMARADLLNICNTKMEKVFDNVRSSAARELPWFDFDADNQHDGHCVIVGGGPSLNRTIDEIKYRRELGQDVWALNNSAQVLKQHGIIPDAHVISDARPENADFVKAAYTSPIYYIASQCDPAVFDALGSRTIILWHPNTPGILDVIGHRTEKPINLIGGGTTVGINAIVLAYLKGYRKIHLYGFDSSYEDGHHHAYPQTLNDGERVIDTMFGDKRFKCAAWMAGQANEFSTLYNMLTEEGCVITAHGSGLIPHMCWNFHAYPGMNAPEIRASEVLKRLNGAEHPVGAEIGVFAGRMSRALLKGNDKLKLIMVDPWEGGGTSYTLAHDDNPDWHRTLSQAQQDSYNAAAYRSTQAFEDRREIIRARSLDAAKKLNGTKLDFAFIDGDHSYEACKADIEAWVDKVKPGGWLCGHDYDNQAFPFFGVTKAVDEFAAQRGLPLEIGDNYTWFIRLP